MWTLSPCPSPHFNSRTFLMSWKPCAFLKKWRETENSTFEKCWNLILQSNPELTRKWVNVVPELTLYCVTFHCVLCYWCQSPDAQEQKICKILPTSFSRYEVRNFLENFVFSILNRVVLMELCNFSLETSYEFSFPSTTLRRATRAWLQGRSRSPPKNTHSLGCLTVRTTMIYTTLMHRLRSRRGTKIPHNAAIDALLVKITETELAIQARQNFRFVLGGLSRCSNVPFPS
jgi:hypothetical protein